MIKTRSEKPIWVYFKYERMPNFCYLFGAFRTASHMKMRMLNRKIECPMETS